MTEELLALLWMLEATIDKLPRLAEFLDHVVDWDTFTADELPQPLPEEREPGIPDLVSDHSPQLGE